VYEGWTEALRELGHTVASFNLHDRLDFYSAAMLEISRSPDGQSQFRKALTDDQARQLAVNGLLSACYQFWPDVVLVVSAMFVPIEILDVLRSRGHHVVVVHTESPYEDGRQAEVAQHATANILNDPTNLDRFPPGTVYLPHAVRPTLHRPGPSLPELECDFAFCGTAYFSRIAFFEAMDLEGLDVILVGNWQALSEQSHLRQHVAHADAECLDNERTVDVYRSARVGINLYRREAEHPELSQGWAMGPREVEMAAIGCFYLRDPRGEGDELLPWLPTFTSPGEASELLRYWLARPGEREALARKSMEAVANRTFTENARRLLALLEKRQMSRLRS